jgi:hypothetical protein
LDTLHVLPLSIVVLAAQGIATTGHDATEDAGTADANCCDR